MYKPTQSIKTMEIEINKYAVVVPKWQYIFNIGDHELKLHVNNN